MPYKDPDCPAAKASSKRRQKRYKERHLKRYREITRRIARKYYHGHKAECKERMKDWREKNPERHKELAEKWRRLNPEKVRESSRKSARKWRQKHPDYASEKALERRLKCLIHYGGNPPKCNYCGESHIEFLTIDHIHGGGKKHRRRISGHIYRWLIKNNFPEGFQILCWNCNCGKNSPKVRTSKQQCYNFKIKSEVVNHYGGKCKCCGESRIEFLSIDHIEGDGYEHRRRLKMRGGLAFYLWLKRNGFPDGYRVLCHNCNSSLGIYGYCPHNNP